MAVAFVERQLLRQHRRETDLRRGTHLYPTHSRNRITRNRVHSGVKSKRDLSVTVSEHNRQLNNMGVEARQWVIFVPIGFGETQTGACAARRRSGHCGHGVPSSHGLR